MERLDYDSPDGLLEEPAAVFQDLNGKRPSPATCCRWARTGIAGNGGERIRLRVWYVGRVPRTTKTAALEFLARVTAAHRQKLEMKSSTERDATDEELRAAGLVDVKKQRSDGDSSLHE